MKRYRVKKGISQKTKRGMAHAYAIITAEMLSISDPEKFLEDGVKLGKFEPIEEPEVIGMTTKMPIADGTQEMVYGVETEKEESINDEQVDNSEEKTSKKSSKKKKNLFNE
jgi:hypothetical protein